MAEKLSVIIALEGAEEIKRQLADVGKAGQKAFADINQAAGEVGGFNKLDPSVITEKMVKAGVSGKEAFDKINTAVKQAGRMETLVNGLIGVENGLVKVQTAASALDAVLAQQLLRSLTRIARFLPLAFASAVVGSIATTTQAILDLDAAAIKLGVSAGELAKLRAIFEGLGISPKDAAAGAESLAAGIDKIDTEKVQQAAADMKKFGAGTLEAIPAIWKLQEAEKGRGEAAMLARKELEAAGLSRKTADEEEVIRIQKSTAARSEQALQMIGLFEKMGNTAERNRLIFATFDQAFATLLIQALNTGKGLDDIKKKLAAMPQPSDTATQAAQRLSGAWRDLKTLMGEAFTASPETLNDIALILETVTGAARLAGEAFSFVNEKLASIGLSNVFQNTIREINTIINLLGTLGQIGFQAMKYIEAGAVEAWQTVIGWINKAIAAVREFFGAGGGQAQGAGAQGMAHGGFVGGRGSGTSDSNLAWLSRGEHVMPARAVRQPGVLSLLEALRRSGGNLRSVLDRMGHFALGGMVGAGGASGMSNVTIAFPGMPAIGGLRASSAVVDELRRAAALAQVRSGGRKPSRYS